MISRPTVAEFRTRFPEFTIQAYTDTVVDQAIGEAMQISAIRKDATQYLVAHILSVGAADGVVGGAQPPLPDEGRSEIRVSQMGPKRTEFHPIASQGVSGRASIESWLATSGYGRMVIALELRAPTRAFRARVFG